MIGGGRALPLFRNCKYWGIMKRSTTFQILFCFCVSIYSPLHANDLEALDVAPDLAVVIPSNGLKRLEVSPDYFAPEPLLRPAPKYPKGREGKGQEGLVELVFMIDPDGRTSNVAVTNSTHSDFEESAIDSVRLYEYSPAKWKGTAYQSVWELRVIYLMYGRMAKAGRDFYKLHKRVNKELDKAQPDQKSLRKDLDKMLESDYLSMYTLAFLNLAEYRYATKFLGKHEQLDVLKKLLLFDDQLDENRQFLEPETLKSIRMNILQLLIQLGYYGEARENYYDLQQEMPEAAKAYAGPMAQVQRILESGEVLARSIKLRERGSEYIYLTKRSLEIHDVKGEIDKLNFYCSLGYSSLDFKAGSNYQLPESWGECNLLIVGTPGATAKMYQH